MNDTEKIAIKELQGDVEDLKIEQAVQHQRIGATEKILTEIKENLSEMKEGMGKFNDKFIAFFESTFKTTVLGAASALLIIMLAIGGFLWNYVNKKQDLNVRFMERIHSIERSIDSVATK